LAEATGLATGAVSLVLSAQSFHWFRPAAALDECARVLGPGGRLAIMWNRPDTTDPLTSGYGQAIVEVGGDVGAARMTFDAEGIRRSGLFSPAARAAFPNSQRFDVEGLVGRARSASYVPKSAEAVAHLRSLLGGLHERHADQDGLVTMIYETEVFVAHAQDVAPSQSGRAVPPLSL
jgi:SAM-dependent methyltransferase